MERLRKTPNEWPVLSDERWQRKGISIVGIHKGVRVYPNSFHPGIVRTLGLHWLGVCNSPTFIFPNWGDLKKINLDLIWDSLNTKNLTPEGLLVRTRFFTKGVENDSFGTPVGFFTKSDKGWIEKRTKLSFLDWYERLKNPSLMIHGSNPHLNVNSIQGRLFIDWEGPSTELVLMSKVVYVRDGREGKFLRLNGGWPLRKKDITIQSDEDDSIMMWSRINPWLGYLGYWHRKIGNFFHRNNAVIEFRLYSDEKEMIFPMQIYDVDFKF